MTKRIMCEFCKETYSEENMDECPNCYGDFCYRYISGHRYGRGEGSKGCDAIFEEVYKGYRKVSKPSDNS